MSASIFFHFPFLIIFKQIVQLWTRHYKHILILLWVFVTDNIVNSEHEMSTTKSLCYMAPPALVSKCHEMTRKMSIRPTLITTLQTTIFNRFCLYYIQLLLFFLGSCSNLNFYEYTLTSVRTAFITNLQSTVFNDHIDILQSHYPEWEHDLFWLWRLYFHFLESFGISKFYEYTSTDV